LTDFARYRKAAVAVLGAVALFVPQVAGADADFLSIYDGVVGLLTAFGVFRVPNAQPGRFDGGS